MTPASLQFEPILAQHAIERCSAAVGFAPILPEKSFGRVIAMVTDRLVSMGFVVQPGPQIGLEFNAQGQVRSIDPRAHGGAPRLFIAPQHSMQVVISVNEIALMNTSYVRWQPFIGSFERFMLPIIA